MKKNILGDIIAIWTADGTLVGRYNYDAWGRILNLSSVNNSSILRSNSFRYRGYQYDNETDFYYLQSRYYDPAVGRFISPDNPEMLYYTADVVGGANLYAYCLNNPITYTDPTGEIALVDDLIIWATVAIIVAVIATTAVVSLEMEYHFIGNGINNLVEAGGGIGDWIRSWWATEQITPAIPTTENTGILTWRVGNLENLKFYKKLKPHRKPKNSDKHSWAERARKMQQGGQKKVLNGRFKPRNPNIFFILPFNDLFDNHKYDWLR